MGGRVSASSETRYAPVPAYDGLPSAIFVGVSRGEGVDTPTHHHAVEVR